MFLFSPQGQIQNIFFSGLLKTVTVWPPQAFTNRLTGYLIASSAFPTAIGQGAMAGMQSIGDTGSGLFDSVSNSYNYIYNTAGIAAGFVTSGTHLQSKFAKNPNISVKHFVESISNARMYIGWSSANTLPVSDTPLANTDQGVLVGFRSTDANYTVFHNDGTATVTFDLGLAKDTAIHTISINVLNGKATCSVDNNTVLITTKLPSSNTILNLFIQTESV